MFGLLRKVIEKYDSYKYPHEYPDEMSRTITYEQAASSKQKRHMKKHGHINKYFDVNKGYFTLYDFAVYVIIGVFMIMVIREVNLQFKEKHKAYMFICLIVVGICALLY
jgi:hypothetical protein